MTDKSDEFDKKLEAFSRRQKRGSIFRPILYVGIVLLGVWLLMDWQPELSFYFQGNEPVSLGTATEFSTGKKVPDLSKHHNEVVSVSGIPVRQSKSSEYDFFKLVGAHIYVQRAAGAKQITNEGDGSRRDPHARIRFEGKGRFLAFDKLTDHYSGVLEYYEKNYGTDFCSRTDEQNECVDAYLLQAGTVPADHVWYVIVSVAIILFMLLNLFWVWRWFRPPGEQTD